MYYYVGPMHFYLRLNHYNIAMYNIIKANNRPHNQCLSQDLDFFPKKELFKLFRDLFAKERSYQSTTKLHD